MPRIADALERESHTVDLEPGDFERLLARRERKERNRRIRAGVVGVAVALVMGVVLARTIMKSDGVPADPMPPRADGEFIVFAPSTTGAGWDLAAQDPETGEVRTIVETDGLVGCPDGAVCSSFIKKAEWSADGRWVAFEISNSNLNGQRLGPCGPTIGIWVQGPEGMPRQLTAPCDAPSSRPADRVEELWEWSPVGSQLAYARIDGEIDELSVLDPSDGTLRPLVRGNIDYPYPVDSESVAWSPDGSRIAYADGSSVYAVDVESAERSLLADPFKHIVHIAWAPDGSQILVHDRGRYRIQVMNADGSDVHVVFRGEDACCETAWSPNGDRIVYMITVRNSYTQVWTVAPDGSNPIKVADHGSCGRLHDEALPVWADDGTRVAYLGCVGWVVENADGTGDVEAIDELVWRSWKSSGLTGLDLTGIGQNP
jgi:Tol biopolymer transport system component